MTRCQGSQCESQRSMKLQRFNLRTYYFRLGNKQRQCTVSDKMWQTVIKETVPNSDSENDSSKTVLTTTLVV